MSTFPSNPGPDPTIEPLSGGTIPFAEGPGARPFDDRRPAHTGAVAGVRSDPVRVRGDDAPAPGAVVRSEPRRFFAMIVIGASTAMALGLTLKTPTQLGANDISRWCTVWSLLERGTYAIDDCPWQYLTQDKVKKPDKLSPPGKLAAGPGRGTSFARRLKAFEHRVKVLEYRNAPAKWKVGDPVEHFYSSKPPLLPTMMAGVLYPFRRATRVPLDKVIEVPREERYNETNVEGQPGKTEFTLERPKEPAKWPAYVFYLKPLVVLLNVVPMLVFLILYARLLDRTAATDWAWFLSLFTAALGTYLFVFDQTLNNHTVAAWSGFFSVYALQRIWGERERSGWLFAAAGFFGAFCACNELPAAVFGVLLFLLMLRFPVRTLKFFLPAALIPCLAFLATQYAAFGQFKPVYEEFGTRSYLYYGSKWTTPLEMDWFNLHPEPKGVYLFHMTLGHHGVFSLTPIFVFSVLGALRSVVRRNNLTAVSWLTLLLTAGMFAFYTWNPKARNYGGSTQGLRWLFWLIPFWLAVLPAGLEAGQRSRLVRGLSLAALCVSAFSVGYALRAPWSHPWVLDMMEHLNMYVLKR